MKNNNFYLWRMQNGYLREMATRPVRRAAAAEAAVGVVLGLRRPLVHHHTDGVLVGVDVGCPVRYVLA